MNTFTVMQAPKTLRRPANWQDFETLCLKLWGEIWSCHEIKKNGRIGQTQHGVDIYGIPSWDTEYYGIQCKGKDEYTDSQFTKKEIDEEIEKAKSFKPKLKKLYFATTAVKDALIEEYVRNKNLEHKTSELFEVHLYSWEDIVDKIDENKRTHDWYVKSQNYKVDQSVEITFGDNTKVITRTPKFKQEKTEYIKHAINYDAIEKKIEGLTSYRGRLIPGVYNDFRTTINKSYVEFRIVIHNSGKAPIEDYKLLLTFKGNILHLDDTNENGGISVVANINRKYTTFLNADTFTGKVVPIKPLLVGDDTFTSDKIYLKPHPTETKVEIEWKLLSRDFQEQGVLIVNLLPEITYTRKIKVVDDVKDERIEFGEFKDVTVYKEQR